MQAGYPAAVARTRRANVDAPGVAIVHPGCPATRARASHHGAMTSSSRPSSSPLRHVAAAAAAAAALAAARLAPSAHAATTVASELRATDVAAWAGTVAWSSYDPDTNDYHLVVSRNGGAPPRPPVAPPPPPARPAPR